MAVEESDAAEGTSGLVRYSVDGEVATITFNRPDKLNMLTHEMAEELVADLHLAEDDDRVKVVVLKGVGRSFCGGYDLDVPGAFQGLPDETRRARIREVAQKAEWMKSLFYCRKPTIAAVHGPCTGIGAYIVLVSDLAIAADDTGLGFPEERLGSAGATWAYPFLALLLGMKLANELVLTGRRLTAEEAASRGMVNRVVDRDRLDSTVASLAAAVASVPRDGIALNRTARHDLAYGLTGYADVFPFHAALHPMAEHMRRDGGEFDLFAVADADGISAALEERNRRFGGDWWGWGRSSSRVADGDEPDS